MMEITHKFDIEFQFSTEPAALISFDGRILEIFWATSRQSSRVHIFQIAKIWIETDKHGVNTLNATAKYAGIQLFGGHIVSQEALEQTRELIAIVQQAMAQYA